VTDCFGLGQNKMGSSCGTYGGKKNFMRGLIGETWRNETSWKT